MKTLLLLCATVLSIYGNTNAQSRLSLYEEFTGEACSSCAGANPTLDALMANGTNPSHVLMIKYMCNIPAPGPMYYMTDTSFETDMQTYYSVPFAPFGTFDGQIPSSSLSSNYPGFSSYVSQSDINQYSGITAPFDISANYHYNAAGDSITVNVTVNCINDYAPTAGVIKLRIALCKSLEYSTMHPLANGETELPNVVRAMYPNATGTPLANSWTAGSTQTYTITGAVPSEYNADISYQPTDSNVVVWIQNNRDHKIAQTALAQRYNLGVTNIAPAPAINIYPNPAINSTMLSVITEKASNMTASIFDATGHNIATISAQHMSIGANNISINTTAYAAGTYFIKVNMDGNIVIKTFSIVK